MAAPAGETRSSTRRQSARLAAASAVAASPAAAHAAVSPRARSRRASSPPPPAAFTPAWWLRFGRHTRYGNGLPRPLLRGWLHLVALAVGVALLAAAPREPHEPPWPPRLEAAGRALLSALRLPPPPLHATAWRFAAATLISYVGSVAFHLFPWASLTAYQRALCFDFNTISLAFTFQIAALQGWAAPATALSLALSLGMAALCVAGLAQGALMWQYHRSTRRTLVLAQIALSCGVEGYLIQDKRVAVAIGVCKVVAFQWFAAFGRYDAPRSSGLVLAGVWADHDNFHVIATLTHVAQVAACAAQGGWLLDGGS